MRDVPGVGLLQAPRLSAPAVDLAAVLRHELRPGRIVRRLVAEWTGSYQYTIDRVIEDMITRARELQLRLKFPFDRTKLDFTILVTVQTMNHLHSGRHRVAL